MATHVYAEPIRKPLCPCGKPASVEVFASGSDSRGHRCAKCWQRWKAAHHKEPCWCNRRDRAEESSPYARDRRVSEEVQDAVGASLATLSEAVRLMQDIEREAIEEDYPNRAPRKT